MIYYLLFFWFLIVSGASDELFYKNERFLLCLRHFFIEEKNNSIFKISIVSTRKVNLVGTKYTVKNSKYFFLIIQKNLRKMKI